MSGNISLNGLPAALELVDDLTNLPSQLREPAELANELLLSRVRLYPSPPGGSEYQRTFDLQNSWESSFLLSDILWEIKSGVPYGEYVMGEAQAWMHQGRWDTLEQILTDEEAAIVQIFEEFIQGLMNRV